MAAISAYGAGFEAWGTRIPSGGLVVTPTRDTHNVLVVHAATGESSLRRGDETFALRKSSIAILAESDRIEADGAGGLVCARISRERAGLYADALRAADGRIVYPDSSVARIVAPVLLAIADAPRADITDRLVDHAVGLIGLMCGELGAGDPHYVSMQRAKAHIENSLSDVDLNPTRIAHALNMSPRTLHRIFEMEGTTINGWVRARRIDNCRRELADPHLSSIPVSQIGARWGLWEAAHFSRLFKATYGTTPTEYRRTALLDANSLSRRQIA